MKEKIRAAEVIKRLPEGRVVGAEVGVWRGYMSAQLLQRPHLVLIMVDHWRAVDTDTTGFTAKDQSDNVNYAIERTQFASERRYVMPFESIYAAGLILDGYLNFVFIDADHSYEGVKSDIESWLPKLCKGGLLGGHDYGDEYPGVIEAVDEAVYKYGWSLDLGGNKCWFVKV